MTGPPSAHHCLGNAFGLGATSASVSPSYTRPFFITYLMLKLFRRFGRITGHGLDHIPGIGLGLYLAREMALLHGGDIRVESALGKGSRFVLTLPLAPAS